MVNFDLAPNEGIIVQYEGVYHNRTYSTIALTNHNLICVEHNNGFLKTTYNVLKYPLSQIKVINGQAQASVVKDRGNWLLQILMKSGTELFEFRVDLFETIKMKKEADNWVEQISLLLTGNSATNITDYTIMDGAKSILSSVGINMKSKETTTTNVTSKCIGCMAPLSGKKGQRIYCKYCETEQTL